ncbi:type II secretion system protein GspN [Halobacteriovorax sp.]|uniref:type II secretion system protein GspN n=1 Tax=Halobacteriovorax sp. TaxID=2020862 RepID=UPI003AF2E4C7
MQETMSKNENNIQEETYKLNKKTIFLIIVLSFSSVIIGFLANFSFEDKIYGLLQSGLKKNRQCPIFYKKAQLSYFLPGLELSGLEVSGRCLRTPNALTIKSANVSLGLPSVAPIGISFSSKIDKINGFDSTLNIKSIHNFSTQYLKLEETRINLESLRPMLGPVSINGNIDIEALVSTDLKALKDLDIYLRSKDLVIPSQIIQSFEIPTLAINNLSLKASSDGGPIEIKELILGTQDSPIRAKASGIIDLDKINIKRSKLEIEAQVKFSPEFIEQFAILNLILGNGQPDEQGFYHMRINGTLGNPGTPIIVKP